MKGDWEPTEQWQLKLLNNTNMPSTSTWQPLRGHLCPMQPWMVENMRGEYEEEAADERD